VSRDRDLAERDRNLLKRDPSLRSGPESEWRCSSDRQALL
jgi:hypothetical protein